MSEHLEFDVVIVGAGPAGLSAAIRLAQSEKSFNICVLEKGAYVGAHILSGAVLEPSALNQLIPDWQEKNAPVKVAAKKDAFLYLTETKSYRLPTPKAMHNQGNYLISLGKLCQWLAEQAEQLGVNIFPGFPASDCLFEDNKVVGVKTQPAGLNKQGEPTDRYQAGVEIYAKQVLLAEGCRGSLTEKLITHYELREHAEMQTYAIGLKERWRIQPEKHELGKVIHTIGWPLDRQTYGGSFIYHTEDNTLSLGLVIGLDYKNPYLNPFQELQRFKTHPYLKQLLADGECIAYGARALNEGGYQCLPKLTFPGGQILGCSAGMVNVPKIKGIHNAMQSGILAADSIVENLGDEKGLELINYEQKVSQSTIKKELYQVRNVRPAFHYGLFAGLIYSAVDQYLLRGKAPWTLRYKTADHDSLTLAHDAQEINYPKPDKITTFDRLTQVSLTATQHDENEPCHLKLKDSNLPIQYNLKHYDAPEQRYCPAGVYEIVKTNDGAHLQINAANCIHCKTCDIKDPKQNILWCTPEGGDGPNYNGM